MRAKRDDPFAIVHALLGPKLIVKGICATHFASVGFRERSYEDIKTILAAMEIEVTVFRGQTWPLSQDKTVSEAASFIVEEAICRILACRLEDIAEHVPDREE